MKAEGRFKNDEAESARLGELTTLISSGSTPKGGSEIYLREGPVMLIRSQNVRMNELTLDDVAYITHEIDAGMDRSRVQSGDVLLNITGASIGRVAAFELKGIRANVNQHVCIIRPKPEVLFTRYLTHLISSQEFQSEIDRLQHGGTRQALTFSQIADFKIPLPHISEQQRIALLLDRAEALRAKRRTALAQLDSLTQSLFLELFGNPVSNPKNWPKRPFGEICNTRLGKMLDQKQQTGQHLRPYLRNANVQWFRFELADVFQMDFDEQARKTFRLEKGDLLICEGGEPGRAAVWQGEIEECYYQKALHRARPRDGLGLSEFLVWQLWFLASRGGLGDHVTSATIAHLTGEKLNAMQVPLPPMALQREFSRRAAAVERLKTAHRASLAELDVLFASLQHRAFRGEL